MKKPIFASVLRSYESATQALDWKLARTARQRERWPYAIVRRGSFDYGAHDELQLVRPALRYPPRRELPDGVVARRQIAEVRVWSLDVTAARRRTLELVAEIGPASGLRGVSVPRADRDGGLDGVRDIVNMPLADEPERVRDDLDRMAASTHQQPLTRAAGQAHPEAFAVCVA